MQHVGENEEVVHLPHSFYLHCHVNLVGYDGRILQKPDHVKHSQSSGKNQAKNRAATARRIDEVGVAAQTTTVRPQYNQSLAS